MRIENGVWIGAGAIVMAHVRPVPVYAIVGGNPAIIRMRGADLPREAQE